MELNRSLVFKRAIPVVLGALLGYGYYFFIGCKSGTCPISGNPFISTIYGAVAGAIIAIPGKNNQVKKDENSKFNK